MKKSRKYWVSGIDTSHVLAEIRAMKNPHTTIFGCIAAAAGAIAALPDVAGAWHLAAVAIAAAATACFAFFAKDAESAPIRTSVVMFCLAALGASVILCSCTIAGFGAHAVIPSVGDYSVTIAGGSIGNRPNTNTTPIVVTNTP